MMDDFRLEKALSNPKFEGYKLQIIDQDEVVSRYPLPYLPSQATASGRSLLTFKEVQSRVSHNHLYVPASGNDHRALYIDGEYQVVLVGFDDNDESPRFRVVFTMPKPLSTGQAGGSSSVSFHPEYPSASFLNDDETCLVSDGHGLLYILKLAYQAEQATLVGTYQLPSLRPFRVHTADKVSDDRCLVVLSFLREKDETTTAAEAYEVCAAQFNLPLASTGPSQDVVTSLDITWQRFGSDSPADVLFDATSKAHLLLGGSQYTAVDDPGSSQQPYQPTPDEIVPIPRAGENLDSDLSQQQKPPPPFSWYQTGDSLTVTFPLPASTPKSAIRVTLAKSSLSLRVLHGNPVEGLALPSYTSKKFWGEISVDDSLWTWDREAGHSFGLLSLHLEKSHDSVRWPHLFEPSPQGNQTGDKDDVPETLDPSELVNIRESLEKYTASLQSGEDASGLGLGHGAPSLAQGEMDDELDSSVGKLTYQTWVPSEAGDPTSKATRTPPFTLLSSPLPGSDATGPPSIITKTNVDGNLFCVNHAADQEVPRWQHVSAFPALSFVLASKRDSRFTYHTHDSVFLLENGTREGTGNMFVYRKTKGPQDMWAKQSVLKITAGGIALLGVGAVRRPDGKSLIVCLTEKEIIIVNSVL